GIRSAWALGADIGPSALRTATRPLTAPGGTAASASVAFPAITGTVTSSAGSWPPRKTTDLTASKPEPVTAIVAAGRARASPAHPVAQLTARTVAGIGAGAPPRPGVATPPPPRAGASASGRGA